MPFAQTGSTNTTGTSLGLSFGHLPQAGNLLVVAGWCADSSLAADAAMTAAGFTAQGANVVVGTTRSFNVWYKISDGTETSTVMKITATASVVLRICITEIPLTRASVEAGPVTDTRTLGAVTTYTTPSISPTATDDLIFLCVASASTGFSAMTWPADVTAGPQQISALFTGIAKPGVSGAYTAACSGWANTAQPAAAIVIGFRSRHSAGPFATQ